MARRLVFLGDPAVRDMMPGIALSTLYMLARTNPPRLPGIVKIGRRVMIDIDKLETWIDAGGHKVNV